MPTLGADVRLRNKVVAIDGTVVLVGAGHVDRAIRFTKLPDCLKPFMTKVPNPEGGADLSVYPVLLNLDRGPDQEAWAQAKREAFIQARRDKPMPEPLQVAAENKDGWSLDVDDVPVVEIEEKAVHKAFKCETCTVEFPTEKGLDIHKGRTKHV